MNPLVATVAFIVTGLSAPLWAQSSTDHQAHHLAQAQGATVAMVPAEVRKVDKEAGKITLKHEAIPNLEMPAMTMVFRVSDPKLLEQVQSGDKVRVAVEKVGGQFTVTKIEQTP
jgi:Cu/Ag efflux protein CusF